MDTQNYRIKLHCEPDEHGKSCFEYYPECETSAEALKMAAEWAIQRGFDIVSVEIEVLS